MIYIISNYNWKNDFQLASKCSCKKECTHDMRSTCLVDRQKAVCNHETEEADQNDRNYIEVQLRNALHKQHTNIMHK